MDKVVFIIGDKLPLTHEAVINIVTCAPGGTPGAETKKRTAAINAYASALIDLWSKAFGPEHVQSRKTVCTKLRTALKKYYNEVVNIKPGKSTRRERIRRWRENNMSLIDILRTTSNPNEFAYEEKTFYEGQKGPLRVGYVSEKVDEAYQQLKLDELYKEKDDLEQVTRELQFIGPPVDASPSTSAGCAPTLIQQSVHRSGLTRLTTTVQSKAVQTETLVFDQPEIRIVRKCTDDIKRACTSVSIACGLSLEKSRLAVQLTARELYHHEYKLEPEEETTDTAEGTLSASDQPSHVTAETVTSPPTKRKKSCTPTTTADECARYKYVLPSRRTLVDFKHLQSTESERQAAVALFNKSPDVKVTLHYDTTPRSCIDGEWASLILRFTDKTRYSLRPIYFAFEDRENITRLIIETYERLATAATTALNTPIEAANLWANTTALMTDAVSKNLHVEQLISEHLRTEYVPFHLLCKSHTVEAFDRANIQVMADIEKSMNMRQTVEQINPNLKSWFRGEKAVFIAGIKCLINLISHEKSAYTTNLADEFDHMVEREGKIKYISLYQERRFTKLGYICAALVDALPLIQTLLVETNHYNQHVEAARLYTECEFFLTELQVIAYFSYHVTLPFLNCVEVSDQPKLLQIFPKLYVDLKAGKTNTLCDFHVEYSRLNVNALTEPLQLQILFKLCDKAADVFPLQCGREYGFGPDQPERATNLSSLSTDELSSLPTNNLECERELSVFDRRARVAKSRNKQFKARSIRDDLTLYHVDCNETDKVTRTVQRLLNSREQEWTEQQKSLLRERIKLKQAKAKHVQAYQDKLLCKCKSWSGPFTSVDELETTLRQHADQAERIVRTELTYFRQCHRSDMIARPDLYKINGISHEERLENLSILLNDSSSYIPSAKTTELPSNTDALQALSPPESQTHNDPLEQRDSDVEVNHIYVTLWEEGGRKKWYIGYCTSYENGKIIIDHLHRTRQNSNVSWKYPDISDCTEVVHNQLLSVQPVGQWDMRTTRNMTFRLQNVTEIIQAVDLLK